MNYLNELLCSMASCVGGNLLVCPEDIYAFEIMIESALDGQNGLPTDLAVPTRNLLGTLRRAADSATTPQARRALGGFHIEYRLLAARLAGIGLPNAPSPCWSPVAVLGTVAHIRHEWPHRSPTVRAILESITEEEDPSAAGVLGDCLQEYGFDPHLPLIRHLCQEGPHIRGCWAVAVLRALENGRNPPSVG